MHGCYIIKKILMIIVLPSIVNTAHFIYKGNLESILRKHKMFSSVTKFFVIDTHTSG